MRILAFFAACLFTAGALAAPPGKPAPQSFLDKLLGQLKTVENAEDAKPLETQILAAFLNSGSPSIDLLMGRASAALTAGNKDVARHLYESVTSIAPHYAEGWHKRGLMQSEAGDDGAAMVSLQKAVELNPRHFAAMAELGEMLEDYGDKAGALKMYRRAIALDPQYEGLQRHIDGLSREVEGQGI
ncbi:tetratricopeptide (TPR) repeat protein [Rhizomicrobium palustre]|uniref:Tetratricopeptide (TPR) repeat protein n=1 Tax=Rhizomicrobium palustre TaxID=189966 RepID=A0A846MZ50_9PROT|nr:tetratricopeptide repeat protein [Rhizomicrobium palustre]NIK88593.1 tetratricopeptide (TPR) repeat protein [Rhizomicrobium palustre]